MEFDVYFDLFPTDNGATLPWLHDGTPEKMSGSTRYRFKLIVDHRQPADINLLEVVAEKEVAE